MVVIQILAENKMLFNLKASRNCVIATVEMQGHVRRRKDAGRTIKQILGYRLRFLVSN